MQPPTPPSPPEPAGDCTHCGDAVFMDEVIIYHGVVYHARCVLGPSSPPAPAPKSDRPDDGPVRRTP